MTEATMLIEDVASTDASKIIKQVLFAGQLDESNIDEKSQTIYQLITQFPKGLNLIFDFEKLEYMNSKSIGYLTDWYGKVTEGGGHLVITKAKPNIVDILSVIGLTQLIPMFGSLDEAKFSLLNATPTPVTPEQSQPVISTNNTTPTMPVTPEVPAAVPAPVVTETPVVAAVPTPAPTPAPEVVAPVAPVVPEVPVVTPAPEVVAPAVAAPVVEAPVALPPVEVPVVMPAAEVPAVVTPEPAPMPMPVPTPEPTPTPVPVATPEVTPAAPVINLAQ